MKYQDTKLIIFLKTFTKEEINDFERFLSSPYFRKGRDPLPLLKALKKFHPDFTEDKFSEEAVFNEIYPGQSLKEKNSKNTLRSLSSYLLKFVEEFIYISRLRDNKVLKNRILLNDILDRNLLKNYEPYMKQAYEDLESEEDVLGIDELEKHQLEKLNSRYFYTKVELENYFAHSSDSITYLSVHFWINLLAAAKSRILGKDNDRVILENNFVEDLLDKVDLENLIEVYKDTAHYGHIRFHFYVYKFLRNGGDSEALALAKQAFTENKPKMNKHDRVYYYSDLINMYHTRFMPVSKQTKHELLEIIKSCLDDKAYKISDEDNMHPFFYRNAILCADYLQECDWAYEFIEKFSNELRPELRDNMALYSRALIDYRKGKYEESLLNISKVRYDLVAFKTDVKTLMLRIFYELKLVDQAMATADTVRHYVKSAKEIDPQYKEGYRVFLKYYQKLLKLKTGEVKDNSVEAKAIKLEMNSEKFILQRKWLDEKIAEFETPLQKKR